MTERRLIRLLPLILLAVTLASCMSLSKKAPEIRLYTLEADREPAATSTTTPGGTITIRSFTASPACSDSSFLLRVGKTQVEKDYYNRFVVLPPDLVQDQVATWLDESAIFAHVRATPVDGNTDWVLTGHILRLEGDFSTKPGAAVMAIQFFLMPAPRKEGEQFFGTYEQRIALDSSSPEALTEGWNDGLSAILVSLEADLGKHFAK